MKKIFKYSLFNVIRSKWSYIYFSFFFVIAGSLLYLNNDLSKVIISLMNIILIICPLIATIFGVIYYYDSREFTELLLSQPIKRTKIFIGQYFGLATSLIISFVLGLGIPFIFYGVFYSSEILNFTILIVSGFFLTLIFSALSYLIALRNDNRLKGFGIAIVLWLFLAIMYDGIFLLLLITFSDYPLEKFALISTFINPVDLSRILIILKLDISALMGFTGAVFKSFLGNYKGIFISILSLGIWTSIPVWLIIRTSKTKDF